MHKEQIDIHSETLVSVIMPAFNAQDTIGESISSVLAQDYHNVELIIIDDCSDDATKSIVDAFDSRRIKYLYNDSNCGVAASRNRGMEQAKGEWIAFLDADDIWMPNKLSAQLGFTIKCNADISYTASAFIDYKGMRYGYIMPAVGILNYKTLLKRNLMSCSSVMVRRRLMERYPFPARPKTHEDYAVWLKIVRETGFACGLNEPLLLYRLSCGSKSANRIKSAVMTCNAYMENGYPAVLAGILTLRYAIHSIIKRFSIKRKGKTQKMRGVYENSQGSSRS